MENNNFCQTELLGDHITVLTDYHANGSYKILKENVKLLDVENYAVMIRTTNFEKNDFSSDLKYINKHAYEFLVKSKVKPGDILMNKIANAGSVYYMPDLKRPVSLAMNLFLIRTNQSTTNQRYIYYYLKLNEPSIKTYAIGTAATTITKQAVRNLKVCLPSLTEQNKIVAILSAYDDLIENNLRRIKILEEMAQLIYREWFVHFCFPGYDKIKMVDSPLGKIPEVWEVRELSEFVDFERGVEPGSKNYYTETKDNRVPFFRVGDLGKRKSNIYIDKKLSKGRLISSNDIAVTMDGTVGLVDKGLEGAYSSGIRKVVKKETCPMGDAFIFQLIKSDIIQKIIETHAKGTTIKHASSSIGNMIFPLPNNNILSIYEELAAPFESLVFLLQRKNTFLSQTRDLLLPKLISGELDVSDLDITLPEEVSA